MQLGRFMRLRKIPRMTFQPRCDSILHLRKMHHQASCFPTCSSVPQKLQCLTCWQQTSYLSVHTSTCGLRVSQVQSPMGLKTTPYCIPYSIISPTAAAVSMVRDALMTSVQATSLQLRSCCQEWALNKDVSHASWHCFSCMSSAVIMLGADGKGWGGSDQRPHRCPASFHCSPNGHRPAS